MIGDLKVSDLISKDFWDKTSIQQRVINCTSYGLEGKTASKAWGDLTIIEALTLNGKVIFPRGTGDPFMTPADFERAKYNREYFPSRYPDMRQETDESRARRRAERQRSPSVPVVKKEPVWDSAQMKMVYK